MNFFKKLFAPKVVRTDIERRFELIGRVGQGSMSKVWRARDSKSGKVVALKVLDLEKTRKFEARFSKIKKPTEGEIAVTLKHPHIVRTSEYGTTLRDEQFLVMEFIEGVSLSFLVDVQNELLQQNRLKFMIELAEAIEYFHRSNWIHRDICPRNVLVDQAQSIKLIDFGLVVPNTPVFQQPGNRTGTANYMAPELIRRRKTDQRIDIFSYSVTCYEMWTKRLPWEGGGGNTQTIESLMQNMNNPPDSIVEFAPSIPAGVADAIMKGLETEPAQRWSTMGEMLSVLRPLYQKPVRVTEA